MNNALTITTLSNENLFILEPCIESITPKCISGKAIVEVKTTSGVTYDCIKAFSVYKSGNNTSKLLLEQICTRVWKMAYDELYSKYPELKGKLNQKLTDEE